MNSECFIDVFFGIPFLFVLIFFGSWPVYPAATIESHSSAH